MDKLIPPRLCAYCHEPFTPTRPEQKYCPKPATCRWKGPGEKMRGRIPVEACAAKRQRDAALIQQRCDARFGSLTAREVEIYRFAYSLGYDQAYQVAYNSPRKRIA